MNAPMHRRNFLSASAAFAAASAAGGFGCVEIASAQPIQVPTIDKLTMRVLIDQAHDQFLRGSTVNGVVHEGPGPGRSADARNVLHNQWGLSLFLETERGQQQRTICSTSATRRRRLSTIWDCSRSTRARSRR